MVLTMFAALLLVVTLPFSLCTCIKVVAEYERSVIFRLGRLRKGNSFSVVPNHAMHCCSLILYNSVESVPIRIVLLLSKNDFEDLANTTNTQ